MRKEDYREFCEKEMSIPIFSQAWWLDLVCGENNWDVLLYKQDNKIIASLPYYSKKVKGLHFLMMPKLTQNLGVWIKHPDNQKETNKLSFEKKVISRLIDGLPKFDHFEQNFHPGFKNWLPFYWKGFNQSTAYTYVLENIDNPDQVFGHFRSNIKTDIRKAQKICNVVANKDMDLLFNLIQNTYSRQKRSLSFGLDYIKRIEEACNKKSCSLMLAAIDKDNRAHAAIYVVWDNERAYYLLSGADPELRNSGATSLLLWEAIQRLSGKVRFFDFEGSMNESIERYFRGFGAKQTPYFKIWKTNHVLLKIKYVFKNM